MNIVQSIKRATTTTNTKSSANTNIAKQKYSKHWEACKVKMDNPVDSTICLVDSEPEMLSDQIAEAHSDRINKNGNSCGQEDDVDCMSEKKESTSDKTEDTPVCVIIHSWKENENATITKNYKSNLNNGHNKNNSVINSGTSEKSKIDNSEDAQVIIEEEEDEEEEQNTEIKRRRGRPRKYKKTHLTVKDIFPEIHKGKRSKKRKKSNLFYKKLKQFKNQLIKRNEIYVLCKNEKRARGRPRKNSTKLVHGKSLQNNSEEKKHYDQAIRLERNKAPPRKFLSYEYLNMHPKKNRDEIEETFNQNKAVKRKRGRPRKYPLNDDLKLHSKQEEKGEINIKQKHYSSEKGFHKNEESVNKSENEKRKRGRPRKYPLLNDNNTSLNLKENSKLEKESLEKYKSFEKENIKVKGADQTPEKSICYSASSPSQSKPKRGRGRPRKYLQEDMNDDFNKEKDVELLLKRKQKRKRGRPKKQLTVTDLNEHWNKNEINLEKENLIKKGGNYEEKKTITAETSLKNNDDQNNKNILMSLKQNSPKYSFSPNKIKNVNFSSASGDKDEDEDVDIEETSIIVLPAL